MARPNINSFNTRHIRVPASDRRRKRA